MSIVRFDIWDFRPPYRDGSYVMSHVVLTSGLGRIIWVTLADGTTGLGEVVFSPTSTEADRQAQIDREQLRLAPLLGQPVDAMLSLAESVRGEGKIARGVAFGMETAAMDALAKQHNESLTVALGGEMGRALPNYFSISERSPDRVKARMALSKQAKVVQLKIGVGSLQDDREQIAAVLSQLDPEQVFLADTNGGWQVEDAVNVIQDFNDPRLIWEEPCKTYEENIEVANRSGAPVMVDQCVSDEAVAMRAIEEGRAAAVCIKPAFLGGVSVARRVRDRCNEAGMKMRIDGPWCGDIANAAILHLAAGADPDLLLSTCDLREPLLIEPDLEGVIESGGMLSPPAGPGLGITADKARLGKPAVVIS